MKSPTNILAKVKPERLASDFARQEDPSARTSFSLSQVALAAVDWLTEDLGSPKRPRVGPPKEIFDNLFRKDGQSFLQTLLNTDKTEQLEKSIVDITSSRRASGAVLARKSFVISSSSLKILNSYSKKLNVSRDELVEFSLLCYRLLIESYLLELLEKQKQALELIKDFENTANRVQNKVSELFEGYDPIGEAFSAVMMEIEQFRGTVEDALETGVPITRELKVWG